MAKSKKPFTSWNYWRIAAGMLLMGVALLMYVRPSISAGKLDIPLVEVRGKLVEDAMIRTYSSRSSDLDFRLSNYAAEFVLPKGTSGSENTNWGHDLVRGKVITASVAAADEGYLDDPNADIEVFTLRSGNKQLLRMREYRGERE